MRRPLLLAAVLSLAAPVPGTSARSPAAVLTVADPSLDVREGPAAALDDAFALLRTRKLDDAERRFAELSERDGLTDPQRARALCGLARVRIEQERREDARAPLARATELALGSGNRREIGWSRHLSGMLAYGEGRIEESRALWTSALDDFAAAGDPEGAFEALEHLSLLVTGLARRPLLERALAIARTRDDPLFEARARRRWGHALLEAAHPGAALVELERAVALLRPLGRPAGAVLGDTLALMGWALRVHGASDRSVAVHEEALRQARERNDLNAEVWNYLGLGTALAEIGQEDRAQDAMSRGLEAARRTGIPTNIRFLSQADGWIALRRREWARAASMLEEAMAMPGLDSSVLPLIHLSQAYRELGRLDDAVASATKAADSARALGIVDNEIRALIELGQVRQSRGELDEAESILSDVMGRLESYRTALAPVDFLKQGFAWRFADAYGLNVDLLMRRGRAAEALGVAERSRSRAFADLLATRRVTEAEEAETAAGRWALGASDAMAPRALEPPDSVRWVPALGTAELAALARALATTIVVYWVHDAGSYAWVVRGDGEIRAVELDTTPSALRVRIQRAVDAVPDAVLTPSEPGRLAATAGGTSPYRALYRTLWKPIEPWLPSDPDARVTVLPHGPLFTLPFGALVDDRGRYLIERYALHYVASGAVLSEALARTRPKGDGAATRALLVADPSPIASSGGEVPLRPLPGARGEARAIEPLMTIPVDLLVGRRASESAVRDRLPGARIVHFATHALVRDQDPLGSHLLLAATAGATGTESDGRLTAGEVTGLRLSSDLVVLGACRSARGAVSSDGIAGLTRAFMAAGAPSIVATLWDVSDVTTSRVIQRFYRSYLSGISKDRALRAAQLQLLRDLRAGRVTVRLGGTTITYPEHPHLWAGAILVGAP